MKEKMKDMTFASSGPHTDKEYQKEIDRLGAEIRQMLEDTRRSNENSKRLGQKNRQKLEDLEKMVLCWKD